MWFNEWLAFHSLFLNNLWYTNITVWLLHGWCHMKLLPSQRILCTPYFHALSHHFMQSYIHRVHVTFHLHLCSVSLLRNTNALSYLSTGSLSTVLKYLVVSGMRDFRKQPPLYGSLLQSHCLKSTKLCTPGPTTSSRRSMIAACRRFG